MPRSFSLDVQLYYWSCMSPNFALALLFASVLAYFTASSISIVPVAVPASYSANYHIDILILLKLPDLPRPNDPEIASRTAEGRRGHKYIL